MSKNKPNQSRSAAGLLKKVARRYLERYFGIKFQELVEHIQEVDRHNQEKLGQLQNQLTTIAQLTEKVRNIVVKQYDSIYNLRQKLYEVRRSDEYQAVFKNKNPLISVRIATYNRANELINTSVRSVLEQTYQNWELIIVGDHCTDDTEKRVKELDDPRIIFINLPFRSIYLEDPERRWMVAGSPGMNKGAELARGDWIAPLDDDDEFLPDHLDLLVKAALNSRYEVVYGDLIIRNKRNKKEQELISSYPPEHGKISSQAMLYMRAINFFEWDTSSWVLEEPGDWNFIRRMVEAGVLIGKVNQPVGILNSTTYFANQPKKPSSTTRGKKS